MQTEAALPDDNADDDDGGGGGGGELARPFVHFFGTRGILQHNDLIPHGHPTDVGAAKVASHLIQFIKLKFGWEMVATGPE